MVESSFQFTNPSLTLVNFKENKDFKLEEGKEIEIRTDLSVSNTLLSETEATVGLLIKIGSESTNTPFNLEVEVVANFRWAKGMEQKKIDLFMKQNAPALLLSYARPIIAMITNSSHFPVYNIPFINFTE